MFAAVVVWWSWAAVTTAGRVTSTDKAHYVTTTAPFPTGTCGPSTCSLPNCRCVGSDIPGDLPFTQVPQIVLLTFDDGINEYNFIKYDQLFPADQQAALKNPNGCRTGATFFVSGDNTDMELVKALHERGNEMASHSITHGVPSEWSRAQWEQEMEGMRERLAQGIGQNVSEIRGMRAPYLLIGSEPQYAMLEEDGFLYDSSMYGGSYVEDDTAPLWPFTLKYPPASSEAVCDQPKCPARSYPHVWEVPLVRQYSLDGLPCAMTDECTTDPGLTEEDVLAFLWKNFDRHYTRNRSPFMISLHPTWFDNVQNSLQGLKEFLTELSGMPDVWQVSVGQMLDWVRNPLPMDRLDELKSWQC
nr:hypothetical protein BaRGS_015891 [Batillaria attramentaria]